MLKLDGGPRPIDDQWAAHECLVVVRAANGSPDQRSATTTRIVPVPAASGSRSLSLATTPSALPFNELGSSAGYPNRPRTSLASLRPYRRHRARMLNRASAVARAFLAIFASRADLLLENLALRQQLAVLQRKHPRPRLRGTGAGHRGATRNAPAQRPRSGLSFAGSPPRIRPEARRASTARSRSSALRSPSAPSRAPCPDLLDHGIVLDERHLQRLLAGLASYYLNDRTHLSLEKDAPAMRIVEAKPDPDAEVIALPRLGGLHHRYAWRRAA